MDIQELVDYNKQLVAGDLPVKAGCDEFFSSAATENDVFPQGDLYFRRVTKIPEGYKEVKPFKKMVPGTTIGSKHVFKELPKRCFVPENWTEDENYQSNLGPIVVIGPNVLEHHEHGNIIFEQQEDMIEFRYQNDWDVELAEIKRQQD